MPRALLRLIHVNSQGIAASYNYRFPNGEPDRCDGLAIRHAGLQPRLQQSRVC